MKETVLITGAFGFIGTNLLKFLKDKDFNIRILDNLSVGKEQNLYKTGLGLPPNGVIIEDIRNEQINEVFKDVDTVIHLAAFTGVLASNSNPKFTWDVNVNGTMNLLECCRKNEVKKIIFASTNAVLGNQPCPFIETQLPKPLSVYGASKLACEDLLSAYHSSFGIHTIALRFSNCYGYYSEHKTSVIRKFINQIDKGENLVIYGSGQQTRDFVWAEDVCNAIYLSMITRFAQHTVIQIGSGVATKIIDLAKMLINISGKDIKLTYENQPTGEIRDNYSNINFAKITLGYEPKMNLYDGLKTWLKV